MGAKLAAYFNDLNLHKQVKLAMLTQMSRSQARNAEDSPENIKLFEDAMKKVNQ